MLRKALPANQGVEMLPRDSHSPYVTVSNAERTVHLNSPNTPGLTCLVSANRKPLEKSTDSPQKSDQESFETKRS